MASATPAARVEKSICFDCSKREIFTPSSGLKSLRRKLQSSYKINHNKDGITLDRLGNRRFLSSPGRAKSSPERSSRR